jgi:hypothetical protein
MASEQIPGGFYRAVAEDFIRAQANKTLFGRSYLKLGQCTGLWGYLFELGGLLGAKHRVKLDAFVLAFLGMGPGAAGVAERGLVAIANKILGQHSLGSMDTWHFVGAEVANRIGYKGEWHSLIMERGTEKIPPALATKNAWEYAAAGTALGTMAPDVARGMWERTRAEVSKERWQLLYSAGLDIGPEPPARESYEQAQDAENKNFIEYCRQAWPNLYPALKD